MLLPRLNRQKIFGSLLLAYFTCQPIKMSEAARVFRQLVTSSISPPPKLAWPVIGPEISHETVNKRSIITLFQDYIKRKKHAAFRSILHDTNPQHFVPSCGAPSSLVAAYT